VFTATLTIQLPNVESLAEWKKNGGTLIAQKLVEVVATDNALMNIPVALM
jgi:hypothetical protein